MILLNINKGLFAIKKFILFAILGLTTELTFCHSVVASTLVKSEEGFSVKGVWCGEIDPFVVGDACVLYLANKNRKLALVLNFDDFQQSYSDDLSMYKNIGIMVEKQYLKKVSWKVKNEIRDFLNVGSNVPVFSIDIQNIYSFPAKND